MDSLKMQEIVELALLDYKENYDEVANVKPLQDTLLLTSDNGVYVRMDDGSEFQIIVVKCK